MKCLHCGYCCLLYDVIIINPEFESEQLDIENEDIKTDVMFQNKPSYQKCPYLVLTDNKFYCSIHERKWYKKTPCFSHSQIESENSNCRIGEYVKTKPTLQNKLLKIYEGT